MCSVESVWHGRRPCLQFRADKSSASSKPSAQGPIFHKDSGGDKEVEIFPFPVFEQIINISRQARNFMQLARLTQGSKAHGSSPTCASE